MGYKWKPNASQRREFAERMKDQDERKSYEDRKRAKNTYSDNPLSFKHHSFVPTEMQYKIAIKMLNRSGLSETEFNAANQVSSAYICQDKVHHDCIHIINHFEI